MSGENESAFVVFYRIPSLLVGSFVEAVQQTFSFYPPKTDEFPECPRKAVCGCLRKLFGLNEHQQKRDRSEGKRCREAAAISRTFNITKTQVIMFY